MSYMRSSYKSSSYRYSSDGTGSARARGSRDEDDGNYTFQSSSRRTYNLEDGSDDDFATTPSSRRLTSRFSTDNDNITGDGETSRSRFSTSKYKSYLSTDDDDTSLTPSTRLNRYSSTESDDYSNLYSTSAGRRQGRFSYYSEESDGATTTAKSFSRRYTSDLDDLYRVSTIDEDNKSIYSIESGGEAQSRRYQGSSSKTLTRLDSKDAGQVYEAILDYKPPRSATDEICLKEGQKVVVLSKDKPHKWRVRTRRSAGFITVEEGFAPSAYLKATNETVEIEASDVAIAEPSKDDQTIQKDLRKKKDMIVRELLETEEDLIRDMQFVQRTYIRQSESSITPKEIKAVKDNIFSCFKDVFAFHQDVLLKNFQNVSKEPAKIGTVFIKVLNEFDNHNKYFKNLPKALDILEENSDVAEFFNNYAMKIRDEKTLSDHLKMPLQRITDYQLLLKELSKLLCRMGENTDDLEKAIKLVANISDKNDEADVEDEEDIKPSVINVEELMKSSNSNQVDSSLDDSSQKLGKMLKNVLQAKDYFDVIEVDGKKNERFVFLFKTRMFITEVNKNISESQRTYDVKRIVKLSEIEANIDRDNPKAIIINSKELMNKNFPIELRAQSVGQAHEWLELITTTPKIEDDDKSEQTLLNREDSIFNVTQPIEEKPIDKVDENNNKINKKESLKNLDKSLSNLNNIIDSGTTKESKDIHPEEILAETLKKITSSPEIITTESNNLIALNVNELDSIETNPNKLRITQSLKSITKHVGESVTLECKVASGNCNVQWLKDNKIFNRPNGKASKNGDSYCLRITNLSLDDAGMFTFVASDTKESVSSSSTLNVLNVSGDSRPTSPGGSFLPHAPKFKVKLKNTELLQGTTVRFEVVVRGLPVPNITFFKDSKPLKEDNHLKILFQSKEVFEIFIEHVKPEDAGHYKCIAVNPEGQDETSMELKVTDTKDVFWGLDENNLPTEDEINSPRCRSPLFKWFKDGKEFEASERFQVQFDDQEDTIALIFQHVKPGDAGLYTCVASTGTEKISCSAELTVQGMVRELPREPIVPEIKKHLTNVSVSENENVAILEAQISGFPKPKITWFKEDKQLEASEHFKMLTEGEENYTLIVKNVKSEDVGHYKIKACNELGVAESEAKLSMIKKPKITQIKETVEVMESEMVTIEAIYEAVPSPNVSWLKDGVPIKSSKGKITETIEKESCKLVIHKATLEDAGSYQCLVCNEIGEASKKVDVVVNSKPKFLKKLETIEIFEGEVAKFYVKASAVPKAEIEFYRDEVLIIKDKRIQIKEDADNEFSLIINDAKMDDKGKYKCKIKNKYGYDEDSAELIIKRKDKIPSFTEKLRDIEAKFNDEGVSLDVKIDGEPKPNCRWFHDGQEIKDSNDQYKIINDDKGSSLLIPLMTYDHNGQYECIVENAKGSDKTLGKLIVNGPPYVVKHLENVATSLEADVKLTAIIKGNPTPEVKWYLGEEVIKLDDRHKYSYDEASAEYTLQIKKLKISDLGAYRIEANNVFGKCQSKAKVETMSKPLFTKGLENIAVKAMQSNVEMVVQLDKQTSEPLVKWFKDDKEIKDNDKDYKKVFDKLDNSYKLIILKATEEMVGKYKCQVANDFGSTESAARFDIFTKPQFLKGLQDTQCLEGETVSMTVQVKGFPKPEVAFYKDGQDVSAEATVVVKKEMDDIYVLEIENIRIIMSGEYECRIRNTAGEASSKGVIVVNGKPTIVKDLTDLNVKAGEDISLEVIITGKPTPEIKWFKNGKEIAGNERTLIDSHDEVYQVKMSNATLNDVGLYHCTAENPVGKARSLDCNLNINKNDYIPKFVKHIEDAIVVTDDNVRFEAEIQASPAAEVVWYKNNRPLQPSDKVIIKKEDNKDVLILKQLQIDDSGSITCEAKNLKGSTKDTAKLEVNEPTMPSISGLKDVALVHDEPFKIEAIVTGFPKPIVQWYRDGQSVDEQLVSSEPRNDRYILNFEPFTSSLAGKYTCSAHNSAGEAIESFAIDVSGKKPAFIKELEETIVMSVDKANNRLKLGQSAIFETIVIGIPTPKVTWLKNDTELLPSHRVTINNVDDEHRLEIKEITKNDVAKYTCRAVNQYGEANSVCLLKFLNEPHPPIVKKELEDVQIEEGEDLNLISKVDGEPMPAVKWYKDGNEVDNVDDRIKVTSKGDGTTSLLIEKSILLDTGVYEVKAENIKGVTSSTCKVLVEKPQRPPKFLQPLKDEIVVDYNKPLLLEATVFGLPTPTLEWFKDDKPLAKDSRMAQKLQDDGKASLKIERVNSEDAGHYSLKATNPNGQATSSSNVQVNPKPFTPLVVDNLPVKVEVANGESLELKAKISAYPAPEILWKKDGVPITERPGVEMITKPDGDVQLKINSAQLEDKGCYEITATNISGEITISTQVNVLSPLDASDLIKKLPDEIDISKGEPLVLSSELLKEGPIKVEWVKDGEPLSSTNDYVEIKQDDHQVLLKINKPSTADDSGVYKLTVKTPEFIANTSTKVNVLKPISDENIIEKLPSTMNIPCGEPIILKTVVDHFKPTDVVWTKDNQPIVPDESVKIVQTPKEYSLKIEKPTLEDSGVYKLVAKTSNDVGFITSSNVNVLKPISDQQIIQKIPENIVKAQDEKLVLETVMKDFAPTEIIWSKDGKEIKPIDSIHIQQDDKEKKYSLIIDKIDVKDSGVYQLMAKTPESIVTQSAQVKVYPKLSEDCIIQKFPSTIDKSEGESLMLATALNDSIDITEISWTKDGEMMRPDDHVHLEQDNQKCALKIDRLNLNDSGAYKLIAKTPNAIITESVQVNVLKPLSDEFILQKLPNQIDISDREPLVLKSAVKNFSPNEIVWSKNDNEIKPNDRVHLENNDGLMSLIIDKPSVNDSGEYKLVAKDNDNILNETSQVNVLKPIAEKDIIQKLPERLNIDQHEPLVLETIVKNLTPEEVIWTKDDNVLKSDDHINIEQDNEKYKLKIDEPNISDSGVYKLVAKTLDKIVSETVQVNVYTSTPNETIIEQLPNLLKIKRGDPIVLKAQLFTKVEPVEVVWEKDDTILQSNSKDYNNKLNDINNLKYEIKQAKPYDSGIYKLIVKTPEECLSTSTRVCVLSPLSEAKVIQKLPDKIIITDGEQLSLQAEINEKRPFQVEWLKDGQTIQIDDRIDVKQNNGQCSLKINQPTSADAGVYDLLVKTSQGYLSTTTQVEVKTPQTCQQFITKLPEKLEPIQDEILDIKAVLTQSLSGQVPSDIVWTKNNENIMPNHHIDVKQDDKECLLQVNKVQPSDSGVYQLTVKTPDGVITTSTTVNVLQPSTSAKIMKKLPNKIDIEETKPLVLETIVDNFIPDQVSWTKDDKPLEPSNQVKMIQKDNKYILSMAEPDSGNYKLIAKSSDSFVAQSTQVEVLSSLLKAEELSKKQPINVEILKDEPLVLKAILNDSKGNNVVWMKNDQPLEPGKGIHLKEDNEQYSLEIDKSQPNDSGVYKLINKTPDGQLSTTSTQVSIKAPVPEEKIIEKLPQNVEINEGERLLLKSKIHDFKPDVVIWSKDGNQLKPNDHVDIDQTDNEYLLRIDNPEPNDSGTYKLFTKSKSPEKEELSDECTVRVLKRMDSITNLIERTLPSFINVSRSEPLVLSLKLNNNKNIQLKDISVYKENRLITDNGQLNIRLTESGEITIRQDTCSMTDSGLYKVQISLPSGSISNSCQVNVVDDKNKIKFLEELKPIEVESGSSIIFECKIDGNPTDFNIAWFKDGEEIMPNEHYGISKKPDGTLSLLVDSFAAIDAGKYMVRVKNDFDEAFSASDATLKTGEQMKTKPIFVNQLESCNIDEKSTLVLKCKIASTTPFTSKWFFGDKELKEGDGVKFLKLPDGTIMLQIDNVKKEDAGKYRVEVTNEMGKSTSEATVKVNPKDYKLPKLLKGLESTELIAGQPGFIELQVDSFNGEDVKFLKDNKPVIPDDRIHIQQLPDGTIRLTFDNVLLDDEGNYTAIVKNNGGEVQSKSNVIVKSKPVFIKKLTDLSVKDGCSAKLEVQVKGNPKAQLTWMRNGFDLEADSKNITFKEGSDGTYFLLIDKCNFRDEAEYSVKATNELGHATTSCKLSIIRGTDLKEAAPKFLKQFEDVNFKPNDTITLSALIESASTPQFIWKKDGNIISMSDHVMANFDGSKIELTIFNANLQDAGQYEMTVKNSLGEASSRATVAAMKEGPPKFTKRLADKEENVKVSTKLICGLDSYPESKIQWFFNGKQIEAGIKFGIYQENNEYILTIDNPNEFDSGLYECVATNSVGKDKTAATIHFIDKDKKGESAIFITKFSDFDVLPGGVANFTACVVGTPKPELKWFKDDKPLDLSDKRLTVSYQDNGMIRLQIENVTQADLGKYRCQASNIYGMDNTIGQLNFETTDGLDRLKETHKSKKSQMRALDSDNIEFKTGGIPNALTDKPTILKMTDNGITLFWMPSIPEQPRFPVSYVVEFAKMGDDTWVVYQTNIKDTRCDVINLEPFIDYSFRVKVENKFGLSDPSPFVTAFRSNLLDQHGPKKYQPEDYNIEHIPREKIAAAPKFLREEECSMYGVCKQPVTIEFWVYGYPEPEITWYFNDVKIEKSEKYNFLQDRNGKTCLFINKMSDSDVGSYTCVAKNEHGEERKTINLMLAEPPVFTKGLDEIRVSSRSHFKLECNVKGTPEPTLKWFKDFQPLHDTSRIKVMWDSPDHGTIIIDDTITRDQGLYSCTATNIVGSTTTAAFVHVDESAINYDKYSFGYKGAIKPNNKPIEQFYDLGDELGRGTQGVTYHAVERNSGKSFASKMMHGMGEMKQYMTAELDVMNQLGMHEKLVTLRDAFASTPHSLSLVMDMCGGGPLLNFVTNRQQLTENEVAHYIKQIFEGLHYMHYRNIGHFGLTIGDVLLDRINGQDIKICDFGLAQRVIPGINTFVEFGHPEFVAPEIVAKNPASAVADVWSAGIIAHILLLGQSPFLGQNDRETLQNIQNKKLNLSDETLADISEQGRDFIRKVLDYDPKTRLDVKGALNHPWLKLGTHPDDGQKLDVIDRLKEYKNRYERWYQNASCKRYYRRRTLHSCFTHPSRMIYPPDEQYSPMVSPDREMNKYMKTISPFENVYPTTKTGEAEHFTSDSHYQCGPDTYLLQLRDTAFPARIRRYLRVAATSNLSIATNLKQAHWGGNISRNMSGYVPQVSIKERRKFTDIMDEEINDEIRGESSRRRPMRLVREVGTSSYVYGQINSIRREIKGIQEDVESMNLSKPFFREKLKDCSFKVGDDHVFTCFAIGEPKPSYTWFRNDQILIETSRIEVKRLDDGRCELRIRPTREYDIGIYKCVASNSQGSAICRARLCIGDIPGLLIPPVIRDRSSNSILLSWGLPKHQFNTPIISYKVEFKQVDETEWHVADDNIRSEYYQINNLMHSTSYHFRLSATNQFGSSQPTITIEGQTLSLEESAHITLPSSLQFVCSTFDPENVNATNNYKNEKEPVPLIKSDFKELYDFKSIIFKGKFSVIAQAYIKDGTRSMLACKCVLLQSEQESSISNEYEILKSLSHEKIANLYYANKDSNLFTLATQIYSGLNVLTYLSRKSFYTEEVVCKIITQVLDAIEYLNYRSIALLELQPDNVLVVDDRRLDIKLTDFANARVIKSGGVKVSISANPEYIAPEVIKEEEVSIPYVDVWCVGVLAYILLSGHSPYRGNDAKETAQNVVFVRYLFDRLYTEVTQEAIRFLLTVFKLTPQKRPSIDECLDNKWLICNDFMVKKRENAVFNTDKINEFAEEFFKMKSSEQSRLINILDLK